MNVFVNVDAFATQSFPAGTVEGNLSFSIIDSVGTTVEIKTGLDSGMTFNNVAPGDYTATCQRLDSTGTARGPQVTASFTVPAGTVDLTVPQTLSVTIS